MFKKNVANGSAERALTAASASTPTASPMMTARLTFRGASGEALQDGSVGG